MSCLAILIDMHHISQCLNFCCFQDENGEVMGEKETEGFAPEQVRTSCMMDIVKHNVKEDRQDHALCLLLFFIPCRPACFLSCIY